MSKFVSTKFYKELCPVSYRQWKAESHCNEWHGYALSFYFEFESETLDVRNWVIDFGSLAPLKDFLKDHFDHKFLLAEDDPHKDEIIAFVRKNNLATITIVEATGCEAIASFLYEYINTIFLPSYSEGNRVWCSKVEVRETDANMAYVSGSREDGEFS